jgi:FkbM family methyltransferase
MLSFLTKNTIIPIKDGKIFIPSSTKHVKIDIGLSYSAPHSQLWLNKEDDLIVFGFEPHPESCLSILNGSVKRDPSHGETLEKKYINNGFYLIPCALGLENKTVTLYSASDDIGCSSIYEPVNIVIDNILTVPCFTLKSFFDLFPFDEHPLIDYIKIDAQGADLDIIKSAEDYISNHIIVITIEAENEQYKNTNNSLDVIYNYMLNIGFEFISSKMTVDPTFINKKFKNISVYYEQLG